MQRGQKCNRKKRSKSPLNSGQTQVDKLNREQAKSEVQKMQTGQADKRELVQGNKDSLAEAELKYTERHR